MSGLGYWREPTNISFSQECKNAHTYAEPKYAHGDKCCSIKWMVMVYIWSAGPKGV